MSQHMAENVAWSKDGFDSCVSVSAESWGKNVRHERYFSCHFLKLTPSTCSNFSGVMFLQNAKSCTPRSVLLYCYWGALAWLTQEMAHRVLTPCPGPLTRTVRFCMFKSTFLCADLSVLMDEDTSQVSSFHSVMEECMPCTPEGEGASRCILTAPSSTRNGCWLSLMLLGVPTLFMRSNGCTYMHATMQTCKCHHTHTAYVKNTRYFSNLKYIRLDFHFNNSLFLYMCIFDPNFPSDDINVYLIWSENMYKL